MDLACGTRAAYRVGYFERCTACAASPGCIARQFLTRPVMSAKKSSAALSTSRAFAHPRDGRCCSHPKESRSP